MMRNDRLRRDGIVRGFVICIDLCLAKGATRILRVEIERLLVRLAALGAPEGRRSFSLCEIGHGRSKPVPGRGVLCAWGDAGLAGLGLLALLGAPLGKRLLRGHARQRRKIAHALDKGSARVWRRGVGG